MSAVCDHYYLRSGTMVDTSDPALITLDSFESYADGALLLGQAGGTNWPLGAVWGHEGNTDNLLATEDFEDYSDGVALAGLGGGDGSWTEFWRLKN